MASVRVNWVGVGLAFIRLRPKTSAAIAFELGLLAAQAVKASRIKEISSKLIDLAPSIGDLGFIEVRARAKTNSAGRTRKPAPKRVPRMKKAS